MLAGEFYDRSKTALAEQVKRCFLHKLGPGSMPGDSTDRRILAAIVPHAGLPYSGMCAAHVYKAIAESERPDTLIILGTSHIGVASCVSMDDWQTPLGDVHVDKELAKGFADACGIRVDERAHALEHSIEVQLPFLQATLADFRIVPIIVAHVDGENHEKCARALRKAIRGSSGKVCILASSDFTHFGDRYDYVPFEKDIRDNLYDLDEEAISLICNLDSGGLLRYVDRTGATICGIFAIATLLEYLQSVATGAKLLKYYTSADVTGDYSAAVGYAGIVFY